MRAKTRRTFTLLAGAMMALVLAMPMGVAHANDTSLDLGARSDITVDPLDFQACFTVDMGGFTRFDAVLTAHGETTTTGSTTVIKFERRVTGFGSLNLCALGGDPIHTVGSLVAEVTATSSGAVTNTRVTCHRVAPAPMVCTI